MSATPLDLAAAVIFPADAGDHYGAGPGLRCTTLTEAITAGLVASTFRKAVAADDLLQLYAMMTAQPGEKLGDPLHRVIATTLLHLRSASRAAAVYKALTRDVFPSKGKVDGATQIGEGTRIYRASGRIATGAGGEIQSLTGIFWIGPVVALVSIDDDHKSDLDGVTRLLERLMKKVAIRVSAILDPVWDALPAMTPPGTTARSPEWYRVMDGVAMPRLSLLTGKVVADDLIGSLDRLYHRRQTLPVTSALPGGTVACDLYRFADQTTAREYHENLPLVLPREFARVQTVVLPAPASLLPVTGYPCSGFLYEMPAPGGVRYGAKLCLRSGDRLAVIDLRAATAVASPLADPAIMAAAAGWPVLTELAKIQSGCFMSGVCGETRVGKNAVN